MKNFENTIRKEMQIGKTVFFVTSVFDGEQNFEKILLDWAMEKTCRAVKN